MFLNKLPMTNLCSTVPKLPFLTSTSSRPSTLPKPTPPNAWTSSSPHCSIFNKFASLSLALSLLSSPPSLASPVTSPNPTTPFSLSKNLELGLEDGKIRPCPSINPGCVSTSPKSALFSFPWEIPNGDSGNAIQELILHYARSVNSLIYEASKSDSLDLQKIRDAIQKTQKNAKIIVIEDTANGQYLQAEVDGTFGRDVLEFLVKGNSVAYRSMAKKVTFIYPFTTAIGDSKGQKERMKKILDQLGWFEPSFEYMD